MAQLKPEERALFEDKNFVTVATVGADGGPRSTPAWVDIEGDEILLNSAAHRAWPKNLRRDPRIALSVFDHSHPYRKVTVIGRVTNMTEDGAIDHIHRLAHKYTGRDYKGDMDRVLIRVGIDKVHAYNL